MPRLIFAALASFALAGVGASQQVPGRDLFEFPLGVLAESPALSTRMAGGLWNPAASALAANQRAQFGFAGLTTPQDQGVRLEMAAGAYRLSPAITGSMSFAQASVSDILRTETDPQSLGSGIPYGTTLLSAGVSMHRHAAALGLAARYRWGSLDTQRAGVLTIDGGVIVEHLAGSPVRVALSTFLFSPAASKEQATYLAAADVPFLRRDSTLLVRGGYSRSQTKGLGHEDYAFATSAFHQLDLSAGLAQSTNFGHVNQRLRLGFGLRHAGYTIAIGREDGSAGFPASYQFLLTRVFP